MDKINEAEYLAEKVCNTILAATSDHEVRLLTAKRVAQRFGFTVSEPEYSRAYLEQVAEDLGIDL